MDSSKLHIVAVLLCFIFFSRLPSFPSSNFLKVGFYKSTCPPAEKVVRRTVLKAVSSTPNIPAALIRMHFHDCFVRGCDASILLKTIPGNPPAERDHKFNNPSLRGFEVIEEAKAQLEIICPNTVSCADIIAFAARDSSNIAGTINYAVPAGRRDGRISLSDEVLHNLPSPFDSAVKNAELFKSKGISVDEMVTLSGAHSIGVSHCSLFSKRLYSFNSTHSKDPSIDPKFAAYLKTKCPPLRNATTRNPTVALDFKTPYRLDNEYYRELIEHRGLLFSDQTLYDSAFTSKMVLDNAKSKRTWKAKYAKAMKRMGSLDVLTGNQGEIRKTCTVVN